jgi:hypothetical protein
MDAQITARPPVTEDLAPRARLPGEPAEPSAEEEFGECLGAAALQPGASLSESSLVSPMGPPEADPRIGSAAGSRAVRSGDPRHGPESRRFGPWLQCRAARWRRRHILLAVAAVIALGAVGASAFLVSPYNHLYPAPQMASAVRHWAAAAGVELPEPLAPAASLAGVPVSPAEPVVRETHQPKKKDQQLQELLALHGGAPASAQIDGQPGNGPPPATDAAGKASAGSVNPPAASALPARGHDPGGIGRDEPPPGYVPTEPGSHPSSPPAASGVPPPPVAAAGPSSPAPSQTPQRPLPADGAAPPKTAPVLPAPGEAPHDATAAVVAALPKPAEATPSSPVAQPPAAVPARMEASAPASPTEQTPGHRVPGVEAHGAGSPAATSAADPVKTVGELRPAPLAPQEQVQVLELVTQIAAVVRDLRTQDTQLRADFGKAAADNAARLADFERRLGLAEARHAVSAAREAGESPAPPATSATAPTAATAARVQTAPVQLTRAEVVPAASDQGAARRYRVQAASPGLALLAEIDRGGGDGAQRQVLVGDTIPGYGRIKAIGQRGTAWVVETEHGNIQ